MTDEVQASARMSPSLPALHEESWSFGVGVVRYRLVSLVPGG